MKENLKIETPNHGDSQKAHILFKDMGYLNVFDDEMYVYAICNPSSVQPRIISFDELRELARPKEYLNDHGELVETNQPQDGWTLVNGRDYIDTGRIVWQRENKVGTVKGRFLHQWAYEAFGRGEDVQIGGAHAFEYFDLNFQHSLSDFNNPAYRFRLKPKTIQIGSRTINKPISVKPEKDTPVYASCLNQQYKQYGFGWTDNPHNNLLLERGILFLVDHDAVAMTDALLELMK